jgi:hypothetical protein
MIARREVVLLGIVVVLVAGLANVFASICILNMGLRKVAEAATSRVSVMA